MFKIYKIGELGDQTISLIKGTKNSIDFSPIYQRYSEIWDSYKKKLFIDSILNGFDIPKFYFNYFIDTNNILNKNNKLYAIIDGKQRLECIFNFIDDEIKLDKNFIYTKNPSVKIGGLKFSEISSKYPQIISEFYDYILDIVFVATDDEDKIEELFLRLNGGAALTNAEKRNAIGGYFNETVRKIVETNEFFISKVRFKNPRYQYQDLLTKLIYIEYHDRLVTLNDKVLNEFVRRLKNKTGFLNELIEVVMNNLRKVSNVFIEKDFLLRSKGIIPIYYFFITRENPNDNIFRNFLSEFEDIRVKNRDIYKTDPDPILLKFDRLNQQGINAESSLIQRYNIIKEYFSLFEKNGSIN